MIWKKNDAHQPNKPQKPELSLNECQYELPKKMSNEFTLTKRKLRRMRASKNGIFNKIVISHGDNYSLRNNGHSINLSTCCEYRMFAHQHIHFGCNLLAYFCWLALHNGMFPLCVIMKLQINKQKKEAIDVAKQLKTTVTESHTQM